MNNQLHNLAVQFRDAVRIPENADSVATIEDLRRVVDAIYDLLEKIAREMH